MDQIDTALEKIRTLGGRRLVERMIGAFLEHSHRTVGAAVEAAAARDLDGLERAAHSLKASAANIGAIELQETAQEIETLASRPQDGGQSQTGLEELVARLPSALTAVRSYLTTEVDGMKRIAVVEDNPDNRLLVEAILEDRYKIVEYETGTEALAGIREDRPDLVLLDISLPGMDGTEVLKRLREDSDLADLPVIALTAHAMSGDRERYLEAGFDDYVSKPIVEEEALLNAVRTLLSQPS